MGSKIFYDNEESIVYLYLFFIFLGQFFILCLNLKILIPNLILRACMFVVTENLF